MMRRLVASSLPEELCAWQSLGQFSRRYEAYRSEAEDTEFFGARGQWLRDGWLAREFAGLTNAREVMLPLPQVKRPDFHVRFANGLTIGIEATEALEAGRRRGDELKRGHYSPIHIIGDWTPNRSKVLPALQKAICGKVERARNLREQGDAYPQGTHLLVYLNVSTFGCWVDEISSGFPTVACLARGSFPVVWVLWNGRLWRLATEGTAEAEFKPRQRRALGWAMQINRERVFSDEIFSRDEQGFRK